MQRTHFDLCIGEVLHCTFPETFLYVKCASAHTTCPIDQMPTARFQYMQNQFEFNLLPQVWTQVLQQVALIEKAIQEFTEEIEKAYAVPKLHSGGTADTGG